MQESHQFVIAHNTYTPNGIRLVEMQYLYKTLPRTVCHPCHLVFCDPTIDFTILN